MNSYPSLVGSSIHSNWRWLEADWSELSSCWLSWTWVWLINEDKLGFPWTEMLDFFCFCFFPFSKMQPDCQSLVKKNLCFWETQTLSSVFSIRTLKIIKQPCNAMSHEDSYFGGVYLERMPDAYFLFFLPHFFFGLSFVVLCFTFLWVAILNSMRRAASVWGAPYTLCIYLHFKIVLNKLKRLPDKLKSHPPLPSC